MPAALMQAKDYTQLLSGGQPEGRYLYHHIFNDNGFFAKRRLARKFRIVQGVDAFLDKVLEPDEKVFHVTQGILNSFFEQMFLGWITNIINRKAFIFTSKRLLLVQLKGKEKLGDLKAVIRYAGIKRLTKTWYGLLKIELHNGNAYSFIGVPKNDQKFMATTIQGLIEMTASEASKDGLINLCPECGAHVEGFPPSCAACGKPFKSAAKAAWLSLVFPGLGDFYLGHRGLAALEMVGTALVWLSIFIPDGEEPLTGLELGVMAAIVLVIVHGLDALVTRHTGRKGIYPA
jgi:hypothetical protein